MQQIIDDLFDPGKPRVNPAYFCEIIGIHDASKYNDTLALFDHKLKENPNKSLIFSTSIPKPNDPNLIASIVAELNHMELGNFSNEDINLTHSPELNKELRSALDVVTLLALKNENFSSPTLRHNFIAKIMIWCNTYLENISFKDEPPICLFYGPLKRHEAYFLMLLSLIRVDVIYFNPCGDSTLRAVDTKSLSETLSLGSLETQLTAYEKRVSKGIFVEQVTTYAKQASEELEKTFYTNDSGIYKPFQFKDGTTRPLNMNSVIEDTLTYWDEEARMRPGFKVSDQTVYTPVFFTKINGTYKDINAYYDLVDKLKSSPKCCFYQTTQITSVGYGQKNAINYHNVSENQMTQPQAEYNQKDLYSLAYCLNNDKTINRQSIKEHVLYQKMLTLRKELQEFILQKLEETFSPSNLGFFNFEVTDKERLRLMAAIFTAEDKLINLIDGFDFTSYIPKIVMYVNNRQPFNTDDAMMIGLLHTIGFDFVLLCPNGANNLELVICEKFINTIQLEDFAYDLELKHAKLKKKSFFNKLFR